MKIILTLTVFWLISFLNLRAQLHPDQPETLGLVMLGDPGTNGWLYAERFEPTGRYFITCSHFYPGPGRTIEFSNGETGVVKTIHFVRGGYHVDFQFDLCVGEFEEPVPGPYSKCWWYKPPNFDERDDWEIKGFALDGLHYGKNGEMQYVNWEGSNEIDNSFFWEVLPPARVRPGYSGSPVYLKSTNHLGEIEYKFLGPNWGASWRQPDGTYDKGAVNPLWLVFERYSENFPDFAHAPSDPTIKVEKIKGSNQIRLTLQFPDMDEEFAITSSSTLKNSPVSSWIPIQQRPGFERWDDDRGPWEKIAIFDPSNSEKLFFRGQPESTVAAPAPMAPDKTEKQPEPAKAKTPREILFAVPMPR